MARTIGGFGYVRAPQDGRDHRYRMAGAMVQMRALAGKPTPRKRQYTEGPILNQGMKPHCVTFSGLGFQNAAPMMRSDGFETTKAYDWCQRNDEWPGENYDGTSVRALMKFLQEFGYISNYVWGQSPQEAIEWMNGGYGTVIIGTYWYPQMDNVDSKGFIQFPGALATPIGGHAYRVNWYDKEKGGLLIVNSWGHNWGMQRRNGDLTGTAYMRIDDFARLLREDGEIAAATQQRIKPLALAA